MSHRRSLVDVAVANCLFLFLLLGLSGLKFFFAVNLFHSILISGVSDFVVFAVISSLPLLRIMLHCKLKFLTFSLSLYILKILINIVYCHSKQSVSQEDLNSFSP